MLSDYEIRELLTDPIEYPGDAPHEIAWTAYWRGRRDAELVAELERRRAGRHLRAVSDV